MLTRLIPNRPGSVRRLQIYEVALTKKMKFDAAYSNGKGRKHNHFGGGEDNKGVVPDWAY